MGDTLPIDAEGHILHFYGLKEALPETWDDGLVTAAPTTTDENVDTTNTAPTGGRIKAFRTESDTAAHAANAAAVLDAEIERAAQEADDCTDPLGALTQDVVRSKVRAAPQLSLSSRTFQPRLYLTQVHAETPYDQLKKGAEKLASVQAQRTDLLKTVVRTHFERFVSAKNTVDQVYVDLKSKVLEQPGYGTEKFDRILQETFQQAKTTFEPMMARRQKVDRIRATIDVLKRFRFYFNLPRTLHESIMAKRDDHAVRDYRRGKVLMQSVTANPSGASSHTSPELQKVFGKVWQQVEAHIATLRARLLRDLNDVMLSKERQEQTIRWLLQLDTKEDPVQLYLAACTSWYRTEMRRCYVDGLLQERALLQKETAFFTRPLPWRFPETLAELLATPAEATKARKYTFRKQLRLCGTSECDRAFATDLQMAILSIRWDTLRRCRATLTRIAPKVRHILQTCQRPTSAASSGPATAPTSPVRSTVEPEESKRKSYIPFVKGHKHNKLSISKSQPAPTPQEQAHLLKVREEEETMAEYSRQFHHLFQTYMHYALHIVQGSVPEAVEQYLTKSESALRPKDVEKPLPEPSATATAATSGTTNPTLILPGGRRASIFAARRPTLATLTAPPVGMSADVVPLSSSLAVKPVASTVVLPSSSSTSLHVHAPPVGTFPTAADAEAVTQLLPLDVVGAPKTAYHTKYKCSHLLLLTHVAPSWLGEEMTLYQSLIELTRSGPFEESVTSLQEGLQRVRDGVLDNLRALWETEVKTFFIHQDQSRYGYACLSLVDLFYSLQKTILRHLLPASLTVTAAIHPILSSAKDPAIVSLQKTFIATVFSFLDTLHFMAFSPEYAVHFLAESPEAKANTKQAKGGEAAKNGTDMALDQVDIPILPKERWAGLGAGEMRRTTSILPVFQQAGSQPTVLTDQRREALPVYREEERWLHVLAALLVLKSRLATKLQPAFLSTLKAASLTEKEEAAYTPDISKALESTDLLKQKILDAYVKRKTISVKETVKSGMLVILDRPWTLQRTLQPIRSFVTDLLILLVKTKSEIREHLPLVDPHTGASLQDGGQQTMTADKMIHHVLRRLCKNAFDYITEYAKQIPQFSSAAATQLVGEVHFLRHALSSSPLPDVYAAPSFVEQLNSTAKATSDTSQQAYFGQHCQEAITQLETMVKSKLTTDESDEETLKSAMQETIRRKIDTTALICAALQLK